jgi:hypothetical protein
VTKKVREGLTMFSCSALRVGFTMGGGGIQLFCEDWDPRKPGFSWGAVTKERRRG